MGTHCLFVLCEGGGGDGGRGGENCLVDLFQFPSSSSESSFLFRMKMRLIGTVGCHLRLTGWEGGGGDGGSGGENCLVDFFHSLSSSSESAFLFRMKMRFVGAVGFHFRLTVWEGGGGDGFLG